MSLRVSKAPIYVKDDAAAAAGAAGAAQPLSVADVVALRPYQIRVFDDHQSGVLILHWSRQIGKSYTLAAWAVDRLLNHLAERQDWLVTVLSNSRENGAEFVLKCRQVCDKLGVVSESFDDSGDLNYQNMRVEVRVHRSFWTEGHGKPVQHTGRIKVLAANPRTARGFSGDLILDEFAFHENSHAIWEAAEPILSANKNFLCRIASTGNGKHNLFYRLSAGPGPVDGTLFSSASGFPVSRLSRTAAHALGVEIYDAKTRAVVDPAAARSQALDKRAYDQNYECQFNDENMCLLTQALIQQAERGGPPIDEQAWSVATLARLRAATGPLHAGQDVGRNRDLSVIAVLEKAGPFHRVVAFLRMAGLRLPQQQDQLDLLLPLPRFRGISIDMTGIGLGLVEYAQEKWRSRVQGVNFATTEPINSHIRSEGRRAETARVTENMATELLARFEHKTITFAVQLDTEALEDLRKPERIVSPSGRVSIAATRTEAGHADHFWALALAIRDAGGSSGPVAFAPLKDLRPTIGRLGMGRPNNLVAL